jgi:uncharacterized protein YjdB
MKELIEILTLLKRIQIGERENHRGICTNIKYLMLKGKGFTTVEEERVADAAYDQFITWLKDNVEKWSKFSGNVLYPVPGPEHTDPSSFY